MSQTTVDAPTSPPNADRSAVLLREILSGGAVRTLLAVVVGFVEIGRAHV